MRVVRSTISTVLAKPEPVAAKKAKAEDGDEQARRDQGAGDDRGRVGRRHGQASKAGSVALMARVGDARGIGYRCSISRPGRWRSSSAVCLLGLLFTLPNLFPPGTVARWPGFLPHQQVSLGLDLRGGSYLLLEVDMGAVEKERLNNLVDELRTALIAAKIGYTGLAVDGDHVAFTLRDTAREQRRSRRDRRRSIPTST